MESSIIFNSGDRVVIRNATRLLNGRFGTIVGRVSEHAEFYTFIVLLDEEVTGVDGFVHKAVSLMDNFLEYMQ